MLIRKGKISDLPKRRRHSVPRFAKTDAWKELKRAIDAGLGVDTQVHVVLTPELKAQYRIKSRRPVTRFVQAYVQSLGLKYHTVTGFGVDEGDLIAIAHQPPRAKRA